jgi:hypothetical protein
MAGRILRALTQFRTNSIMLHASEFDDTCTSHVRSYPSDNLPKETLVLLVPFMADKGLFTAAKKTTQPPRRQRHKSEHVMYDGLRIASGGQIGCSGSAPQNQNNIIIIDKHHPKSL